jgi:hypothetical protein
VYGCRDNVVHYDLDLCRVGADGRNARRLTRDAQQTETYAAPTLSRAGDRLAYLRGEPPASLFVSGTDATGAVQLASGGRLDGAAIAPAGDRVAYVRDGVLYTVRTDGSDVRELGRGWSHPTWIDDRVAAIPPDTTDRLCVVGAGGACERVLAHMPDAPLRDPAVSPDGRFVAAYADIPVGRPGRFRFPSIYAFDTRNGRPIGEVQSSGLVATDPTWSPDSRAIAFSDQGILVAARPPGDIAYRLVRGEAYSPAWAGPAGPRAPRLRITRAWARGRRVFVRGTIARGARSHLLGEVRWGGSVGYVRKAWPRPRRGRIAVSYLLPRAQLRESPSGCGVVLAYPGDATYGWGFVNRRVRGGVCP